MSVDVAYPHIAKSGSEPALPERIPRLRVAQIVADYLAHGRSTDEMCRQHPELLPAEAHSAMAYYFDHQQEIEDELEAELRESEQARRTAPMSPVQSRLRA